MSSSEMVHQPLLSIYRYLGLHASVPLRHPIPLYSRPLDFTHRHYRSQSAMNAGWYQEPFSHTYRLKNWILFDRIRNEDTIVPLLDSPGQQAKFHFY